MLPISQEQEFCSYLYWKSFIMEVRKTEKGIFIYILWEGDPKDCPLNHVFYRLPFSLDAFDSPRCEGVVSEYCWTLNLLSGVLEKCGWGEVGHMGVGSLRNLARLWNCLGRSHLGTACFEHISSDCSLKSIWLWSVALKSEEWWILVGIVLVLTCETYRLIPLNHIFKMLYH